MKKVLIVIVVMILMFWAFPAYALTTPAPGDTLSINDDAVQITQAGTYTVTGTGAATTNTITVDPNISGDVNITLSGVNIDVGASAYVCAFTIGTGTTVNLTLTGTNVLKSGIERAGLNVPVGAVLTIDGTGSLNATSGRDAAGIGGNDSQGAGQINITGGSVTALSIRDGAGIGGGWNGRGGIVTISGGTVVARSYEDGAGIGSGNNSNMASGFSGGTITIEGSADVTAYGGSNGAGIGGGKYGSGGNITINGGTVTAVGGSRGAGIGGGCYRSGGSITISGGIVVATGGFSGAGIGGGVGEGGDIRISGGIVVATGGDESAGIGGGTLGIGRSIDISGGEIYAIGGPDLATSLYDKGHDIGDGGGASSTEHTSFRLSGTAAVLLGSGDYLEPIHRDFRFIYNHSQAWYTSNYGYNHFPAAWGTTCVDAFVYDTVCYFVNFVPQNGSSIDAQLVYQGGKATKPNELIKDGFVFAGWYKDADCDEADKWDFDTDTVEKATTLYAKWITAYTVSFDSLSGSAVTGQTIGEGYMVTEPNDPVCDGYRFGGWYTSSDCNDDELWDFDSDTVSIDMTLYAKWTEIPTYTVTFDSGSGSVVNSQTVDEGEKATKPTDPTRSGYSFGGWYTDSNCDDDDRWNFSVCTVVADMTLFAKWNSILAIDTPNLLSSTIGEDYSCTISASGGDGSYSWYASGLPSGLSMVQDTGIISGKPNETGTFSVSVRVYDGENKRSAKTYSLEVSSPSETGKYEIVPDTDSAYSVNTVDGFTTLTINEGFGGFRYIRVSVNAVVAHEGEEACVFVHISNGVQVGFYASIADYDNGIKGVGGFNVQPGDIIKVYVVDELTNDVSVNPVLLQ